MMNKRDIGGVNPEWALSDFDYQAMKVDNYKISHPVELKMLSDEEIIGDFCKTCDYSLEGCIERGQQSTCASYQEALKQKRKTAQPQRDADAARIEGKE